MAEAEERADNIFVTRGDVTQALLNQDIYDLSDKIMLVTSRNSFTYAEQRLGANDVIFKYIPPFQGKNILERAKINQIPKSLF